MLEFDLTVGLKSTVGDKRDHFMHSDNLANEREKRKRTVLIKRQVTRQDKVRKDRRTRRRKKRTGYLSLFSSFLFQSYEEGRKKMNKHFNRRNKK